MSALLLSTVETALAEGVRAASVGDVALAWAHLERAHILSQPLLRPHLRVHVAMLRLARLIGDRREVLGQLARLLLAPLGALTGRLPLGNSGRARTSPFAPVPLPPDIEALYREAGVRH